MTVYVIVVCGRCGGYLLAKSNQKTRTCPYCNSKILLEKAKKVASADDASKASALLRKLKGKTALRGKTSNFKGHFKIGHQTYPNQ